MKKINLLIAEPFHVVFEGLKHLFSDAGKKYELFRAMNLDELQQLLLRESVDLVLINPVLLQNQVERFNKLKSETGNLAWIGIVNANFVPQLLGLFDGLIQMTDLPHEIVTTVNKYVESENKSIESARVLSEREVDVLKLLIKGNSNKEIADKLNISTHTVISHRKNISVKTGIKSLSGLTIYAVVQNLISLDNYSQS